MKIIKKNIQKTGKEYAQIEGMWSMSHHTTSNNLNHFVLINVNCLAPSHLLFIGDCNLICLHTIAGVRNVQCASAVQFVGLQAQEQDLFHQLKCQHCSKQ